MANENLINIPSYSDLDADWDGKVDLVAGGTDQDFSGYTGVLRVSGGQCYANATLDHVREGTTYGRVLNTHIASGKPIKLAESGGRDLTVVLGAANRILTLGANVNIDQNLRQADSPEFAGLGIGSLSGILKGTSGVVSAITDNSSNWDDAFTHSGLTSGNPHNISLDDLVSGAFVDLTDTPASIGSDDIGKVVRVSAGLELEFDDEPLEAALSFVIDGGGSAIATGIKGDLEVPFDCAIQSVTLLADQSGSIKIDIWKDTYGNFPPDNGDTITGANEPEISGGVKDQDATLSSWATSLTKGDILRFNVDSVTDIQRVTLSLKVNRT